MTQPAPDPAALRAALTASPALCPLEWNSDRSAVLFGRLNEAEYHAASFLDRRALPPAAATGVVPWSLADPWLGSLPRSCDYIFHISHCGSTLLSRLLGSHHKTLAIREPGILRGLRRADSEARVDATVSLLSRRFRPGQRPLVKATSVVNAVAERLIERTPDARAILICIPAPTFLATVLDGSQSDIAAHAAERHERLVEWGLTAPDQPAATLGEQAAAAWLCEMAALRGVAARFPGRVHWIDFDQFLTEPTGPLAKACAFLGQDADVHEILASPLMHRYAKQTDVPYDAAFRERLLVAARDRLDSEITSGTNWLKSHGWADTPPCVIS